MLNHCTIQLREEEEEEEVVDLVEGQGVRERRRLVAAAHVVWVHVCACVCVCVCACLHMPQFLPLQCRHVRHGLDCCVAQGQGRTCPTSRGHYPDYRTQTGGEEGEREVEKEGRAQEERKEGDCVCSSQVK